MVPSVHRSFRPVVAAPHEIQDDSNGDPQGNAAYHHYNDSPCIPGVESDAVVGWALDGYPILGLRNADRSWTTDAQLDACHGRAGQVVVDGRSFDYAYDLTRRYSGTRGCFAGRLPAGTLPDVREGLDLPRGRARGGHGPGGPGRPWGRGGRGGGQH